MKGQALEHALSLYVNTTISMSILLSLCVNYYLYVYTNIYMCILRSLFEYYYLYVITSISMCKL